MRLKSALAGYATPFRLGQRSSIGNVMMSSNNSGEMEIETRKYKIVHTSALTMVPPESEIQVWDQLTELRTLVRDPGLFRWPPHVNLLYPFVELFDQEDDSEVERVMRKLQEVTARTEPFNVTLDRFGLFGGKWRGVLWLNPSSSYTSQQSTMQDEPLIQLQKNLCDALSWYENGGNLCKSEFVPHLTISHYESIVAAKEAQSRLEQDYEPCSFHVDEIYLLNRNGDHGQFQVAATLPLGHGSCNKITVHDPQLRFCHMPLHEEEWVYQERIKLKQRRNVRGRRKLKEMNQKIN